MNRVLWCALMLVLSQPLTVRLIPKHVSVSVWDINLYLEYRAQRGWGQEFEVTCSKGVHPCVLRRCGEGHVPTIWERCSYWVCHLSKFAYTFSLSKGEKVKTAITDKRKIWNVYVVFCSSFLHVLRQYGDPCPSYLWVWKFKVILLFLHFQKDHTLNGSYTMYTFRCERQRLCFCERVSHLDAHKQNWGTLLLFRGKGISKNKRSSMHTHTHTH